MTKKFSITAIILTFNEEKHIARCINSVKNIAKRIIVVDSFSTDLTTSIAKDMGAEVLQNSWRNHASQFNWGLENSAIETDWVMRLDADEYLENGMEKLKELSTLDPEVTGIYIKRKYYFLNQWMKHGSMYPIFHLRLWRNGAGKVEDRWMDERTVLNMGRSIHLDVDIVDDNLNNLSWWINKHNDYASREMIDTLNQRYHFMDSDNAITQSGGRQAIVRRFVKERVYSRLPLFFRPFFYFFYRYIFRLGFLDGTKGLIFHFLQAYWYRMLVDCKIYEAKIWIHNETDTHKIKEILREKTHFDI